MSGWGLKLREKDKKLLLELLKDARKPTGELSEKTGVTRQTINNKIKKLKENGVKFTIWIHPERFNLMRVFILLITRPESKYKEETIKKLKKMDTVSQIHYILGRYDMIIEVIVKDREELSAIVRELQDLPAVLKTEALVVYDTVKHTNESYILKALETLEVP
ncbi:hypothetical protein B6U74_02535 [Candidatus Bathyarchaeota archaeon ex4484_205]|nr:MAG: hypothetical protein B6U74_02535 [Candidatus Bathyarchaeota archaeon ex4484_205]RLF99154.1 MAG: hypothetical protein DRN58_05635 [Thermococci archaeon]